MLAVTALKASKLNSAVLNLCIVCFTLALPNLLGTTLSQEFQSGCIKFVGATLSQKYPLFAMKLFLERQQKLLQKWKKVSGNENNLFREREIKII